MDLKVTPMTFGAKRMPRMTTGEVTDMLSSRRTMPLGTKLPKNLERQISPNIFQRIANFVRNLF